MLHLLCRLASATPAQHELWNQGRTCHSSTVKETLLLRCLVTLPGQGQHTRQQHKQRMVCRPLIG